VETDSKSNLNQRRFQGLLDIAQLGQGICLLTGQYADAAAIGQHFAPVAKELANIADGSDAVAKPIDFLIEVGPYGALIAAALPLVMQFAANHRLVNPTMLLGQGVVPPEVLEAQMKAQVMQMQAKAMADQERAMREAQAAQKEYESLMAKQAA
jgi:hypothetical protein